MDEKYRVDIGARLREERERLGFSQEDFAKLGGGSKRTQVAWERGDQVPNAAFLAIVSESGVDVLYVVTGQRSAPVESRLSMDELTLLNDYNRTDEEGKAAARRVLASLARSKAA